MTIQNYAMLSRTNPQISGRYPINPSVPFDSSSEMMSRPMGDRNYDVQRFTGYPIANYSEGQWVRGSLVQMDAPTGLRSNPRYLKMYDPTDINTWQNL